MKLGFMSGVVLVAALLCGPAAHAQQDYSTGVHPMLMKWHYTCNDTKFLQDQQAFENGQLSVDQLENVCGIVTSVLPEKDTRSGHHGYFYLQVAPNQVIEIVSDLDEMDAPAWPWVAVGNTVQVRGRYYYDNDASQGIDWTHHGTSKSWPYVGYVFVGGTEYN